MKSISARASGDLVQSKSKNSGNDGCAAPASTEEEEELFGLLILRMMATAARRGSGNEQEMRHGLSPKRWVKHAHV